MGHPVSTSKHRSSIVTEPGINTLFTETMHTLNDLPTHGRYAKGIEFKDPRTAELNKAVKFFQHFITLSENHNGKTGVLSSLALPVDTENNAEGGRQGEDFILEGVRDQIAEAYRLLPRTETLASQDNGDPKQNGQTNNASENGPISKINLKILPNPNEGIVKRQSLMSDDIMFDDIQRNDSELKSPAFVQEIEDERKILNTFPDLFENMQSMQRVNVRESRNSKKRLSVSFKLDLEEPITCSQELSLKKPHSLKSILKERTNNYDMTNLMSSKEMNFADLAPSVKKKNLRYLSNYDSLEQENLEKAVKIDSSIVVNLNKPSSKMRNMINHQASRSEIEKPRSPNQVLYPFDGEIPRTHVRTQSLKDKENIQRDIEKIKAQINKHSRFMSGNFNLQVNHNQPFSKSSQSQENNNNNKPKHVATKSCVPQFETSTTLKYTRKRPDSLKMEMDSMESVKIHPSTAQNVSTVIEKPTLRHSQSQGSLSQLSQALKKKDFSKIDLEIEPISVDLDLNDLLQAATEKTPLSNSQSFRRSLYGKSRSFAEGTFQQSFVPRPPSQPKTYVPRKPDDDVVFEEVSHFSKKENSLCVSYCEVFEEENIKYTDVNTEVLRSSFAEKRKMRQLASLKTKASSFAGTVTDKPYYN